MELAFAAWFRLDVLDTSRLEGEGLDEFEIHSTNTNCSSNEGAQSTRWSAFLRPPWFPCVLWFQSDSNCYPRAHRLYAPFMLLELCWSH